MTAASRPKIVFLDRETIGPNVELPRVQAEHVWLEYDKTAPSDVLERLRGVTVCVSNKVQLREPVLAQLPDLKMISVAATGTDPVDVKYCKARGIVVSNVRNYAVHTVPEHAFSLILALRRSIIAYRDAVLAGRWQESGQFCFFDYPVRDLHGQTLGIFGEGSIGQSVATIARGFGMTPLFAAHKGVKGLGPLYTPWDEALERSDVITIHAPLMEATRNMLGAAEFAKMKKKPLIINTARGGLVDEIALTEALHKGQIAGAAFDVASPEPPPPDHPLMKLAMERLPNFILTPHIAWSSLEARQEVADQTIGAVDAFLAGKPVRVVEPM